MRDVDLKYDVIFCLNPQFIIKRWHFFAPKNITVIVRECFSLISKENCIGDIN